MSTNIANAPNTNRIRLRISGTTSAFARLRQIVIDGQSFLKRGAGGFELRSSRRRKSNIAELQPLRGVAGGKDLHAILALGHEASVGKRFRSDEFFDIPIFQIAKVHHRVLGTEDLRGTRLLRHTAAMRKTAVPRGLAAFKTWAFATAGADGLAFA